MRRLIVGLTAALLIGAVAAPAAVAAPPGKVTICHRTASESNPWILINVSKSAKGDAGGDPGEFNKHLGHNHLDLDEVLFETTPDPAPKAGPTDDSECPSGE